jgi:hypothetical protein
MVSTELQLKLRTFLNSKGVYNAIAIVDGERYRVNGSQGIRPAPEDDSFPTHELPEDLLEMVRQSIAEDKETP